MDGEWVSLAFSVFSWSFAFYLYFHVRAREKDGFWLPYGPLNKAVTEALGEIAANNELLPTREDALIFAIRRAYLIDLFRRKGRRVVARSPDYSGREVVFNDTNPESAEIHEALDGGAAWRAGEDDEDAEPTGTG